ncbi:MarR family winged helix-turn-helix transcriptional regulator [Gordonia sputi]
MTKAVASQDQLAAAWRDLSIRYNKVLCSLDRELQAKHGLSSSEFEVLELLAEADDHQARMSELAGGVHLSQSALSRVVGRLEKDGLVARTMCSSDRRSVFATLTASGEHRYAQARPTQRETLASLTDGCPQLLREG